MRNSNPVQAVGILVAVAAVATLLFFIRGFAPAVNAKLHTDIGRALASHAVDLASPGGQVILITRDTSTFKQPTAEILIENFNRGVTQSGSLKLTTRLIQVDPLRPLQVPPGDFFELIRKSPAGSVIVSLMGPPLLSDEQRAQLGPVKAKIVAFCPGNLTDSVDLRMLFERQLLHAAIVSRRFPTDENTIKTPPHTYQDLYVSVSAGDLSALTAPLHNSP